MKKMNIMTLMALSVMGMSVNAAPSTTAANFLTPIASMAVPSTIKNIAASTQVQNNTVGGALQSLDSAAFASGSKVNASQAAFTAGGSITAGTTAAGGTHIAMNNPAQAGSTADTATQKSIADGAVSSNMLGIMGTNGGISSGIGSAALTNINTNTVGAAVMEAVNTGTTGGNNLGDWTVGQSSTTYGTAVNVGHTTGTQNTLSIGGGTPTTTSLVGAKA